MLASVTAFGRLKSIWALTIMGLLTACSGGSDKTASVETSTGWFVSGSVGDGPIVDAEMTVQDANGRVVLTEVGDSSRARTSGGLVALYGRYLRARGERDRRRLLRRGHSLPHETSADAQ